MTPGSLSLSRSPKRDAGSSNESYNTNGNETIEASNNNDNLKMDVTTSAPLPNAVVPAEDPSATQLAPVKTEVPPVNAVNNTSPTPPPPKLPLLQSPPMASASVDQQKASLAESPYAANHTATVKAPVEPSDPGAVTTDTHTTPPATTQTTATNGYRPLNVKDALTYLDQVKIKFSERPEVYNRFLDIMKEFKSQAIDTPGVIERVSTLFKGHPSLISGFNTFLPPGYRIECSTDGHMRDIIKVTTPSGTTSTTNGEPLNLHTESVAKADDNSDIRHYTAQKPGRLPSSYHGNYHEPTGALPPIPTQHSATHGPVTPSKARSTSSFMSPQPTHGRPLSPPPPPSASTIGGNNALQGNRRTPVEFNQAINYVNKIKNRFANDPDTYKQFLEILQTYQKEQRPIQEVYAQVRILFNGAEDLLAEFKQFLPDTTTISHQQQQAVDGTVKTTKYKKRTLSGLPRQRRKKYELSTVRTSSVRGGAATGQLDLPTPLDETATSVMMKPVISAIEAEFFERVRKHIGNKPTYQSFLRVLNLFSQQMIDANMLIDRCEPFLGSNKELYDQLKKLVGYDGKDRVIENVPLPLKQDYTTGTEYGPSYRSVPKACQAQNCSGRDALCWEVLNDEFVSHPTWASEDSGFIASKKNMYEEALHRVEDERYSYDMDIEANLNTITLLEPIAKKLATMTEAEKANFKLSPGIGGPSKCIYQRIIRKIYGGEQGREIIDMLHNHPAQTVPVILKRLKQKDEEWRKSQREWNKVWREIEAKNYYKALDYQGVIFKTKDRKTTSVKYLVSQIEAIRLDQISPEHLSINEPQLCFKFKSKKIFKDVTRVLYSFFERQTVYGHDDCEIMKAFIEMFLPVFFDVPDVLPETEVPSNSENAMEDETTDMEEDVTMEDDTNKNNHEEDDDDNDTQNSYDS